MATEPNRYLSPEELAKREAEKKLLGDQILKQHPEAAKGFSEFRARLPLATEGGGKPPEIDQKTAKIIAEMPEGHVDASLSGISDVNAASSDRHKALLQAFVNDEMSPDELNRLVMGDEKKE